MTPLILALLAGAAAGVSLGALGAGGRDRKSVV